MIRWPLWFVLAYLIVVLTIDSLAVHQVFFLFDWRIFRWYSADIAAQLSPWLWKFQVSDGWIAWLRTPLAQRIEVFCALFWFIIPFLACLRAMDWGAFGLRGLNRWDALLLTAVAVAGVAVMFIIPQFPELRAIYPTHSALTNDQKWNYVISKTVWNLSWLIGWEFLHRYVLLRAAIGRFPQYGWLLVPLSETLFHLQKPLAETAGMLVFSVFLTRWAMARGNVLAPALAHFFIECDLILFRLMM